MKMMNKVCIVLGFCCFPLLAITVAEKREQLISSSKSSSGREDLSYIQKELTQKKDELRALYDKMYDEIYALGEDSEPEYKVAHQYQKEARSLHQEIRKLEQEWKIHAQEGDGEDFEGLWHQPDTTIGQLVIDYSSGDAVYVMSPEVSAYKIHLNSKLSVPKASWNEMLEVVLANFGVGIKKLSPFVKQLYFLRTNQSGIQYITDERSLVDTLSFDHKIAFVCSPQTGDIRRIVQFLEKFAPQDQVSVQIVGGHLVLIGLVGEIKDLLKVYDFVASPKRAQEHRIITLHRANSEEVAKILSAIFEGDGIRVSDFTNTNQEKSLPTMTSAQENSFGFRVLALKEPASSLFITGKKEQVDRAVKMIDELEASIGQVKEKSIHWYACRHSEAEDLAKVLSQVYKRIVGLEGERLVDSQKATELPSLMEFQKEKIEARAHAEDALVVESSPVSTDQKKKKDSREISENFIVDPKTNSIIMVVENFILPKLKELLNKLDVPKKMVQIDVLLFEKKVCDSSSMGLSKLRVGDAAADKSKFKIGWSDGVRGSKSKKGQALAGILNFFLGQKKSGDFPAYDLAYQFLLSQEDIQINANPSMTTVNQTPVQFNVVDQISINTGVVELDRDHVKDSYSRAEYGIIIKITPTVHAKIDTEESDDAKYVTLSTDIIFDSTRPDKQDRPDVTRRNIKNEVRVRDGETVILGGLRRKLSSGQKQMIPFLGELPGIGKLFSMSTLSDTSTEMFAFLTPRILPDEHEAWRAARSQELEKRPGDTPEFLQEKIEAQKRKGSMVMAKSFRMLFGQPDISR